MTDTPQTGEHTQAAPPSTRAAGLPGSRTVVRRVFTRLFGPPPFDAAADPGDPGLTGPGSASWRVIAEPAAIAGGIRGLVMQVAHPLAMAGVADHSAFRTDPLGRLHRTSAYVTATTFGSTREALEISLRVRRVHPHVRGTAPDGRSYRADDPRLLTWVSVALTSSFLAAQRHWVPWELTASQADEFVAEQSGLHALLDPRVDVEALLADPAARTALRDGQVTLPLLETGVLPRNTEQLADVLRTFEAELALNHQGREALRFLRRPTIPYVARPGYRALLAGAVASLDPPVAAALNLSAGPLGRRAALARAGLTLTALRVAVGTSPAEQTAGTRVRAEPVGDDPLGRASD